MCLPYICTGQNISRVTPLTDSIMSLCCLELVLKIECFITLSFKPYDPSAHKYGFIDFPGHWDFQTSKDDCRDDQFNFVLFEILHLSAWNLLTLEFQNRKQNENPTTRSYFFVYSNVVGFKRGILDRKCPTVLSYWAGGLKLLSAIFWLDISWNPNFWSSWSLGQNRKKFKSIFQNFEKWHF